MKLPQIELDDRRFQDLVSEARARIVRTCPEWQEHNIADPGITLIELFAWMTEATIYRLNRIPDKLHMTLLELLGIRLAGPHAARTELRFLVNAGRGRPTLIPAGTEVGVPVAEDADDGEAVVFSVEEDFTVPVLSAPSCMLRRADLIESFRDVDEAIAGADTDGVAMFGHPPGPDDALGLGFSQPLGGLVVRLEFEGRRAAGDQLDPRNPPLSWEVSQADGGWAQAEVLGDSTGGFLLGSGTVELQLPPTSTAGGYGGQRLHWLRCRVVEHLQAAGDWSAAYADAPTFTSLTVTAIGAQLRAVHAARHERELLGISDGTPGQTFRFRNAPVLPLGAGETLEVEDLENGAWRTWEPHESFAGSFSSDPHFRLDHVSGTVELGPAIREIDGSWTQYGAVPPRGAALRFTSYRAGGGRRGNVAPGALSALRTAIENIVAVTNPSSALGGVDPEGLESARERAAMEIQSRYRAVTAADFEFLAREASPRVARAVCVPPAGDRPIMVHVLPYVFDADRRLKVDELLPDDSLFAAVAEYLDERRLIGARVHIRPFEFCGIAVVSAVQVAAHSDPVRVREDILHALYRYLNPLVGGPGGTGWPAGRAMNLGELHGVVQAVDGVEYIRLLRTFSADLTTGENSAEPLQMHVVLGPDTLIASGRHVVKTTRSGE
jgi:predicted phage baseplate assembly protein